MDKIKELWAKVGFAAHVITAIGVFLLLRVVVGLRIHRQSNLHVGGQVVAANHRSFLDPILVSVSVIRSVNYFARANLWKNPVIAAALNLFGGIPVDRNKPELDTIKQAVASLRKGARLLVFPEGTRTKTGKLGTLREGPALFGRRAKVPVTPLYLHRSDVVWPRGAMLPRFGVGPITVVVGPAIQAPASVPPRERDAWVTQRLTAWMTDIEQRLGRGGR